uniref:cell surface protein n=1 Tax=Brachyspira catarrhinii TaxID=2528966 RepID=UPI003F4BBBEF
MKKILLAAMALLTIASTSVFGMYGRGNSWIDFLTDGNQLRARMDQFGFVLGNDTIKGTIGLRAEWDDWGQIFLGETGSIDFLPTVSAGIAYTSDLISVGLGYNYTFAFDFKDGKHISVHTPVLMVNALNNNLRISIPIQVAVKDYKAETITLPPELGGTTLNIPKFTYTGVAFDDIQIRYYTGIDAFNQVRLYLYYRNTTIKYSDYDIYETAEAFGFQTRFYFLNTTIGNVNINPFVRVDFHTALKGYAIEDYTAESAYPGMLKDEKQSDYYDISPYIVSASAVLGITANSDIVSLYIEPSLGYRAIYNGKLKGIDYDTKVQHNLAWGAYTELYITPVKDLEWYFEMNVNNSNVDNSNVPVSFETTTGITWYLPDLN